VNPLFEFGGNRVRPRRPAFSREAALDRIVQACRNEGGEGARLHCVGLHAADEATAQHLLDAATAGHDVAEAFIGSFSPVMVAHTGPGLSGLAWWWETA
jgi:fatty acid-binding protein DegV